MQIVKFDRTRDKLFVYDPSKYDKDTIYFIPDEGQESIGSIVLNGIEYGSGYNINHVQELINKNLYTIEDLTNGHEFVDLGLPSGTLWATMNIGATSITDFGDKYAWGETETKNKYDWSTYKYCKGSDQSLTKYCTISSYGNEGFTDDKTTLEASDDVARAKWGGDWRMPTKEELQELSHYISTSSWETLNGVMVYKIIGPSGNSLIIPLDDYICSYWASTLYSSDFSRADTLYIEWLRMFSADSSMGRCYPAAIRPVCTTTSKKVFRFDKYLPLTGGTLTGKLNVNKGLSVTGGNLEVKSPDTNKSVFKVNKTNGAIQTRNEDGKLMFELNSDGDVKVHGGNFFVKKDEGETGAFLKVVDGEFEVMNGKGDSYLRISEGNFAFQDKDRHTILETMHHYQEDIHGNGQGILVDELRVARQLRAEKDIRLFDGTGNTPTMVIDNTDGSIEAAGQINSHDDVTCGGTLANPEHKLSEKANQATLESITQTAAQQIQSLSANVETLNTQVNYLATKGEEVIAQLDAANLDTRPTNIMTIDLQTKNVTSNIAEYFTGGIEEMKQYKNIIRISGVSSSGVEVDSLDVTNISRFIDHLVIFTANYRGIDINFVINLNRDVSFGEYHMYVWAIVPEAYYISYSSNDVAIKNPITDLIEDLGIPSNILSSLGPLLNSGLTFRISHLRQDYLLDYHNSDLCFNSKINQDSYISDMSVIAPTDKGYDFVQFVFNIETGKCSDVNVTSFEQILSKKADKSEVNSSIYTIEQSIAQIRTDILSSAYNWRPTCNIEFVATQAGILNCKVHRWKEDYTIESEDTTVHSISYNAGYNNLTLGNSDSNVNALYEITDVGNSEHYFDYVNIYGNLLINSDNDTLFNGSSIHNLKYIYINGTIVIEHNSQLFGSQTDLKSIYIKNWLIKTDDVAGMFAECLNLKSVNISDWEVPEHNLQTLELFTNCSNLQDLTSNKNINQSKFKNVIINLLDLSNTNLNKESIALLLQGLSPNESGDCSITFGNVPEDYADLQTYLDEYEPLLDRAATIGYQLNY